LALGILLLLGVVGVAVTAAADPTPTPAKQRDVFMGKVAKILGIDQQKLTNAFNQACKETRNEMIDKALADGRITKAWADWMKQRPGDGNCGIGNMGRMRGAAGGRMDGPGWGKPGQATPPAR
jgi:hypothetical protein